MKTAFMIAAPSSGSGKTTISRGLMALLTQSGYTVQPFKCGPDYIDTKFHTSVCHRPSINLDTFMASPSHVVSLFSRYGSDADVCVVEGMMGLFDGYDRDLGSSAEIARVLGLPIVLVVDARSAAYSMAALLTGFLHFRKGLRFAGVIYNKVGSARHAAMLRQVSADVGLACLGCLPQASRLEQPSRYLGLDFSATADTDTLLSLLRDNIDTALLLRSTQAGGISGAAPSLCEAPESPSCQESPRATADSRQASGPKAPRHCLVARNAESFSFIYQETLDRLGDVRFFDPERDVPALEDTGLLYLPGGYPEKHAEALSANAVCRQAIREYAERGGRIVAECGGMMYLCEKIVTDAGAYPMCGVLPHAITARTSDRRLSLGYRRFELDGREYRGHEFHYTQFLPPQQAATADGAVRPAVLPSAAQVYNARGEAVATPVFVYKNVLASYTHLYNL